MDTSIPLSYSVCARNRFVVAHHFFISCRCSLIILFATPNKTILNPSFALLPLSNIIMRRSSVKFSSILSRFEKNSGSQFDLLRLASSSSLTSTTSSSRSSTSQRLEQMTTPSSHESSYEASEHTGRASLSCRMLATWYDDDGSDDEMEIQETSAPSRSSR